MALSGVGLGRGLVWRVKSSCEAKEESRNPGVCRGPTLSPSWRPSVVGRVQWRSRGTLRPTKFGVRYAIKQWGDGASGSPWTLSPAARPRRWHGLRAVQLEGNRRQLERTKDECCDGIQRWWQVWRARSRDVRVNASTKRRMSHRRSKASAVHVGLKRNRRVLKLRVVREPVGHVSSTFWRRKYP